jgi:outer membrane biosynthesis protein TonB
VRKPKKRAKKAKKQKKRAKKETNRPATPNPGARPNAIAVTATGTAGTAECAIARRTRDPGDAHTRIADRDP